MKNRVVVNIAGENYTIIAEESVEYIQKTAEIVDHKMMDILTSAPVSAQYAAILTSLNLADEYLKSQEVSDNMRIQMKSYLEDASRLRSELNEARREIGRNRKER